MAKTTDTGVRKTATMAVKGSHRDLENGRKAMVCDVDGHAVELKFATASNQDAQYVASVRAMRKADRAGVTDVTIDSANPIVANHMSGAWKRRARDLHPLQSEVEEWRAKFDSVKF